LLAVIRWENRPCFRRSNGVGIDFVQTLNHRSLALSLQALRGCFYDVCPSQLLQNCHLFLVLRIYLYCLRIGIYLHSVYIPVSKLGTEEAQPGPVLTRPGIRLIKPPENPENIYKRFLQNWSRWETLIAPMPTVDIIEEPVPFDAFARLRQQMHW